MASVEKTVRSGRTAWVARWRDPSGRTLTRSFVKRSEADDYLDGIRHSLRSGAYVDPSAGRITVGKWSQRWLAAQGHLKPSTRARYEGIVSKQVAPRWERVPLTAVRHADVAGWVAELALAAGHCPLRTPRVLVAARPSRT